MRTFARRALSSPDLSLSLVYIKQTVFDPYPSTSSPWSQPCHEMYTPILYTVPFSGLPLPGRGFSRPTNNCSH